jgi:hypothetical protein
VDTEFNFTLADGANYTAAFETTDASCTCGYCYNVQDFEGVQTGPLPLCWTRAIVDDDRKRTDSKRASVDMTKRAERKERKQVERDTEERYSSVRKWRYSSQFFQSPSNSIGLNLTGPWGYTRDAAPRSHYVYNEVYSPFLDFYKPRVTFWLKLLNIGGTFAPGEGVEFWLYDGLIYYTFPVESFLKCQPNTTIQGYYGWEGTFECQVEVDLTSVIAYRTFDTFKLGWSVYTPPNAVSFTSKRVEPVDPVTTYPARGVWVDDINFCGDDLPVASGN